MAGARDQVTRMLALVPYLQRGREVSLREVAADFHVKPAQIVKDLNVLWMCGLPGLEGGDMIEIDFESFEDDPDGIVRIDNAEYLNRPMRLDSTQAAALTVALRTLRDGSGADVAAIIDTVLAKLEVASTDAPSLITAATPSNSERTAQIRADLLGAIDADRQVELAYYVPARDEMTTRRVEPQRVLERDGHTYLEAWCHAAEGQRLFRLDRIESLTLLDDVRSRPESDAPLTDDLFIASDAHTLATVHVTERGRWAADYYPVESVAEAPDGGLELTMRVADQQWLFRTLLRMAPEGTLIAPQQWADDFAAHVAGVSALYESGT